MKALKILNALKNAGAFYNDVDEAIAELEAIQESKSCGNCTAYDKISGNCKEDVRITNVLGVPETFYCKWYESKDKK